MGPPPQLTDELITTTRQSRPEAQLARWGEEADERIARHSLESQLLALAKALVLDADVAGSALPRSGERPGWIGQQLADRASQDALYEVVTRRLRGQPPRLFQEQVAASFAPLTLVRAGCGTGKTAAAYLWAARQHAGRQLWVTYPTTGTATEGFRGYVADLDGLNARLEHSRADVDLEIFRIRGDSEDARDHDRLEALRSWGSSVITCTVDTVLGLIQNQRRGLYAFPGLADSALVFDEIHAYDDELFGSLLRFLEGLPGLPALLMTASLQAGRLAAVRDLALRVHGQPLVEINGPIDLETHPRYQRDVAGAADPWLLVRRCLDGGGKVLWVCNTVKRCLDTVAQAEPLGALVYHSRFCYRDRVKRHEAVVNAFDPRKATGAALAVTTQVCEMSLDLSADLLITDLAPIPALIQRLGRLNRRSTPAEPQPLRNFVVLPFRGLPYEGADLQVAEQWLRDLGSGALSQHDLAKAWVDGNQTPSRPALSAWLDGRYMTEPASLREPGFGLTILLEEHKTLVQQGNARAAEWALPMDPPLVPPHEWWSWPQVAYMPVPPREAIHYDPMRGARWVRNPKR